MNAGILRAPLLSSRGDIPLGVYRVGRLFGFGARARLISTLLCVRELKMTNGEISGVVGVVGKARVRDNDSIGCSLLY